MDLRLLIRTLCMGAVGAWCVTGCGSEETIPEPVIRPVRTHVVTTAGRTRVRTFSGTAQAGNESALSFRVAGKIERLAVAVGNRVHAGDLISELDPADYKLQVEEARASLAQARAEQRNARASYDRVRELYENNNASRGDLDQARAASESASAAVRARANSLALAEKQLTYTRLVAPVDGAISEVPASSDENVAAGQTIAVLTSGDRIEVAVDVPGVLITGIHQGSDVVVSFDALPGRVLKGLVTEVGVASTGTTPTFPVTVRLAEEGLDLRPGMAAEVTFRFATPSGRHAVLVPSVAVGEDRDGRYVLVVERLDGGLATVHRRPVRIGELTAGGLEVLSGLSEGERVVTAGVRRIQDGLTVRLDTDSETD